MNTHVSRRLALACALLAPLVATGQPLTFTSRGEFGVGVNPQWLAAGDFDADGKKDIVTANRGSHDVSVLRGNGDGTFAPAQSFPAGGGALSVAVGDFNRDGAQDVVTADYLAHTISVLRGLGNGTFAAPQAAPAGGTNPNCVAVGDFDGDGNPDVAVAIFGGNAPDATTVTVHLGTGTGLFRPPQVYQVQRGPLWVSVDDLNGDGAQDLVAANFGFDSVSVLLGNGDGTFQAARHFAAGGGPASVFAGDFDGDGARDLAVVDYFANQVAVLAGQGNGDFGPFQVFPVGSSPVAAAVADFHGDGRQDLAVANWDFNAGRTASVLAGNGDGTFQGAQNFVGGAGVVGVLADDLDGDGAPDMALANFGGNSVSVLINTSAPAPLVTLGVSKSGTGDGTVMSSPAGIDCGATCSADFPSGTTVTLTAAPAGGSTFDGWSGAGCTGTGACVVTLDAATVVTATFTRQRFTLIVQHAGLGSGSVSSSPPGIDNCTGTCSAIFDGGTAVTLTATPGFLSVFVGWSGGGCSGTEPCTVDMSANRTVTATFKLLGVL